MTEGMQMTPLTQEIANVLPSLRRYGRAVTGDRHTGDRYILVTLEILSEEPWRVQPGQDVKFRLYKLFGDVLSIFEPGPMKDVGRADPYHRLTCRVLDLPLLSRKVLLLVMLERFSVARAAQLLGLPEREAEIHLAGARAQLTSALGNTDSLAHKQAA
jgi:DNA-directed RNA polymerase specialized sigma24 family protein